MKKYINIGHDIFEDIKESISEPLDLLIGGSIVNGFFDNESDVDMFLVVNDDAYKMWCESIKLKNIQKRVKKNYNIDLGIQRLSGQNKIKDMIKSYSVKDDKYTNNINKILPVIAPIDGNRYSIRIKPRKWLKFKKAYENGEMWFDNEQLEGEWIEKLNKNEWKYKKYLLKSQGEI